MFIFDHAQYAHWLSVHLYDLTTLKDVHTEMAKEKFAFLKSKWQFSRIVTDQVHEQNNKIIRGVGGGSDLLNRSDDSSLIRWKTCGPEIVSEFEETLEAESDRSPTSTNPANHREDARAFRASFINDVQKLHNKRLCNLFDLGELIIINNTNVVSSSGIVEHTKAVESEGENQFKMFEKERLIMAKIPMNAKNEKKTFHVLKSDLKIKLCSEKLPT